MKIAILRGPRQLVIEHRPLPDSLGPHEVRVKTQITAFKIGTDRGNYEGAENVPGAPDYPRWVGDSNLGIVHEVGGAVTALVAGDRVVSRYAHQSEFVAELPGTLVKVPDGVDAEDAVWAHLYTLSAMCYRKANFIPGENVAVVGLGVLGLGAVALGPLFGARVVGIGNSQVRTHMAERTGAHAAFLYDDPRLAEKLQTFTNGAGIDLVILTANPWPAYRSAVQMVRHNGRVAVVSLLGRGEAPADFNPLAMQFFYAKALSLISVSGQVGYLYPAADESRMSWNRQCQHVLALMADGLLRPSTLVTHRLPYTRMQEAYEMAFRREKDMLGVIFNWQE